MVYTICARNNNCEMDNLIGNCKNHQEIIGENICRARCSTVQLGYQVQNFSDHNARYNVWVLATLASVRCLRRDCCHIQLFLDATINTLFPLVPPDAAHNTIAPPDSALIHSISRSPPGLHANCHTSKGNILGPLHWVVKTMPSHTPNLHIALITAADQ